MGDGAFKDLFDFRAGGRLGRGDRFAWEGKVDLGDDADLTGRFFLVDFGQGDVGEAQSIRKVFAGGDGGFVGEGHGEGGKGELGECGGLGCWVPFGVM